MEALSDTSIESSNAHSRVLYVLMVACMPVLVAGLLTHLVFISGAVERDDGIGHQSSSAQFDYPAPGDLVADQFDVSGRVESVPTGEVVYLVERLDNRFWPKLRIGSEPTAFHRTHKTSPGQGYKYTIELLSLNATAEAYINRWFDRAKNTGKYPGIEISDGVTVLAKARVVHK